MRSMYPHSETARNYIELGKQKTSTSPARLLILAIMAGMFIALAGATANTAASAATNPGMAKMLAALVFPTGLIMVVLAGSELFTGNCLLIIPLMEKEIRIGPMLYNWGLVYIGNFIGSLIIAFLIINSYHLGTFENGLAGYTIDLAVSKTSLGFSDAFTRGIICNILVCIAVWMGYSAKDTTGKVLAMYLPVMAFVLCGMEHSIANMYFIPAGLIAAMDPVYLAAATADISSLTWANFFYANLLPVTLGNLVGGIVFVALPYWFAYVKKGHQNIS